MKLKDFISEYGEYEKAEKEIVAWVEESYPGLTIAFYPNTCEILQTDASVHFTKRRVQKITEAVNIKIGEILEARQEPIYIASLVERIWKKHPDFDIEVESYEDIKRNQQFLDYMKELRLKVG